MSEREEHVQRLMAEIRELCKEQGLTQPDDAALRQAAEKLVDLKERLGTVRESFKESEEKLAALTAQRNKHLFRIGAALVTLVAMITTIFAPNVGTTMLLIACALWLVDGLGASPLPASLMAIGVGFAMLGNWDFAAIMLIAALTITVWKL